MIAVAAVGIIGAIVVPMVRTSLSGGTICSSALSDIYIDIESGFSCYDSNNGVLALRVAKGSADVLYGGAKILVFSEGNSYPFKINSSFSSSSEMIYLNVSAFNSVEKIEFFPIVLVSNSEKQCDVSSSISISSCNLKSEVVDNLANEGDIISPEGNVPIGAVDGGGSGNNGGDSTGGVSGPVITWVYQEAFDGNAQIVQMGTEIGGLFYLNYTKPVGATNNSKWLVKHGTLSPYNITLPQECWDADSDKLILMFRSNINTDTPQNSLSRPYCFYNDSATEWSKRFKAVGNLEQRTLKWGNSGSTKGPNYYFSDGNWNSNNSADGTNLYIHHTWQHTLIYEEAMWWEIAS